MRRKRLFVLYGVVVGLVYAAAGSAMLTTAGIKSPVAAVVLMIVLAAAFALYAARVSRTPEKPGNAALVIAIPLMPLFMVLGLLAIGALLLPIAVMYPFWLVKHIIRDRRFRNALKFQGRSITLDALRPRLNAGEGTLIEDTGQKGPYRIWWTEDDIFSLGIPVSKKDKDAFVSAFKGKHEFNARCLKEYLADDTGKALLTTMPARYARTEKLASMFPRMKVATVVRPFLVTTAPNRGRC
jgi:hypothetical protein